ncbi:tetraspanin [Elysia marginata]|uniref:Tetraspanin n=1 Tax=Elysia marginata TaxID=1093978 RepID=A0AAV4FX38_9GAST|nr:tetraspanin [Elysia marginata]
MAIGTLVELHRSRIEPINNRLAVPTALVIFVGLAIAVNALIGMIGTVMEKPCLLKMFLVVTVLCFLLQVAIGIIAFIFREEIQHVWVSLGLSNTLTVSVFSFHCTLLSATMSHPVFITEFSALHMLILDKAKRL